MSYADKIIEILSNDSFTIIDEADENTTYIGFATRGVTATSEAKFKIKKINKSGTVTTVKYPSGEDTYEKVWDNRASYTYSFLK